MKHKFLCLIFLSLFLIGFTPAKDKVADVKHEVTAIYIDEGSLPSIQAKGDVVRVSLLGFYAEDEDNEINHVVSLSDARMFFNIEYYAHKDDQIKQHLELLGPTRVTQTVDFIPIQKGFQYKSRLQIDNLKAHLKKGLYVVNIRLEQKNGGSGAATSQSCRVKVT